jgi:hypothetical protein
MSPDFNFIGFNPDDELKTKAYLTFDRLLEIAPVGSIIVGALQKDGHDYRCSIEIYSKHGPFSSRCFSDTPDSALASATRSMFQSIERWGKRRRKSPVLRAAQAI